MATPPIQLPPDLYTRLIDAERNLLDADTELNKAEECGLECQELRALKSQYLAQIEAIKKNYAPKSR
jgi:hypothetical protein